MKPKNIQIIFFLAILFFFIAVHHTQAAEWIFCESSNSGHLYYDKASIKKIGDFAQVRTMAILNDDGKIELYYALRKIGKAPRNSDILSYSITLEEFDCVNKKFKLSSMTIYNEKGSTVHSSLIKNDERDVIIPETNGDILWKIVCGGSR